jgi:poly-gamma-glutamate synthesis protein (capsule biosynthesis protein)
MRYKRIKFANNHILEQGDKGYLETISHLNKAGIGVTGNSGSNIFYREINGKKIAIAGFSNVDLNTIKNNGRFAVLNEDNVIETLKVMQRNKVGFKILCFHWGNEYVHIPSPGQRKMAYRFIDEGADIIAGHHPHVIQPFENIKAGIFSIHLGILCSIIFTLRWLV